MATANQFLAKAASQIGYREGWNGSYWNNDTKYGTWYGMNYVAWCAIFVSWCANEVGALDTVVPKYASCWHGLKWFRDRDQTGYWPPRPGDIFIMREYNPSSWTADADGWATIHTGIVEKYLGDGRVQTIEGNTNTGGSSQGNGVYRLIRQDSAEGKRFIYCRPKWDPEPVVPPAPASTFNYADVRMDMTKGIDESALKPKATNDHVARLMSAIWNWRGPAFRKALVANYKLTQRSQLYSRYYSPMLEGMVADSYRLLDGMEPTKGWLTKDQREGRAPLPNDPGPAFLRRIGFKNPY